MSNFGTGIVFVKLGQDLKLFAHLEDDVDNVFVQATLKDELKNELPGSPVAMTNDGDGEYSDTSIAKIRGDVRVVYRVFDDDAFTIENIDFHSAVDIFSDMPLMILPSTVDVGVISEEKISVDVITDELVEIEVVQEDEVETIVEKDDLVDVVVTQGDIVSVDVLQEQEITVTVECP